ncbi:MAG: hypothetical protein JO353_07655 [Phycisphaerae bacterium]|nr:hypothetical protein [Phycisphaerae bacterium]
MSDLILINAIATWYMAGLIWFVQLVHYPLFANVAENSFTAYHKRHMDATGWAVGPSMIVEALSTILLLIRRPAAVPLWVAWSGLAMVVALWLSTALVQVPAHYRLGRGEDRSLIRWLTLTNWLRTALWSARGALMAWAIRLCLRA